MAVFAPGKSEAAEYGNNLADMPDQIPQDCVIKDLPISTYIGFFFLSKCLEALMIVFFFFTSKSCLIWLSSQR